MGKYVQEFRKIISSRIEKTGELDVLIEAHLDTCPNKDKVRTLLIESITFMDLYKKINYKKVTSTLTQEDLLIIPIIDSIIKTEHIHDALIKQPGFLENMLDATYEFYNATILEKYAQIKSLTQEDKEFLLEITPPFQEDLDKYDIKIDIENFYKFFKSLEIFYNKKRLPFMKESVIDQIVGFIKNLYHFDEENFIYIVLKLSLIDYKFSLSELFEETYPDIANGEKKMLRRVNLFEEGSEKDILDYALLDDYYLFELIDVYIHTRNIHFTDETYEDYKALIEPEKSKERIKKIEERVRNYGN